MTGKALFLTMIVLLGGCGTIRRAREAKDPSKIPPGERTVKAKEIGLGPDTVLTLDRAEEIALTYHPSMVQARQSLVIAESQLRDALSGYMPDISASAGADWSISSGNQAGAAAGGGRGGGGVSFSGGVNLSQLIFDFGQTDSAVRQAFENRLAQEKQLLAAMNDLVYQVRIAYYQLSKAEALLVISEDTVKRYESRLEDVKALVAAGRGIKYDITKAEVDLGGAQLNLAKVQGEVKTSRAGLNQSLGLAEDPGYTIAEPPEMEIKTGIDDLVADAKKHNPELLALAAEARSAMAAVDGSIAALFPSITLGANAGVGGSPSPVIWTFSVGPTLVWNLFSGLTKTNKVDQTVAQLRMARAKVAAQEQQNYADLSKGLAQFEDATERIKQAALFVKQAEENLDMVTALNKAGKATALMLTDAQITLTQALSEEVQAHYDVRAAVALVKHTVGVM
jgi:outer membrane protein